MGLSYPSLQRVHFPRPRSVLILCADFCLKVSNEGVNIICIHHYREDVDVRCLNNNVAYFYWIKGLRSSKAALDYRLAERISEQEKSLFDTKGAE